MFDGSPNPDICPSGVPAGFDPAHIAGRSVWLSVVAGQGNLIDVQTGRKGTIVSGTPTTSVKGILGMCVNLPSPSQINFTGKPAISYAGRTGAAIFSVDSVGAFQYIVGNEAFGSSHLALDPSGNLTMVGYSSTTVYSTLVASANVPYFGIVSQNGTSTTDFLLKNLRTGVVKTERVSSGNTPVTPTSGTCTLSFPSPVLGNLAAAMWSSQVLTIPEMLKWSERPWDFWYPSRAA